MSKERYQNPTVNDTVNLRLFAYNANNRASFKEVQKVEVYFLDPTARTAENPDGRTLITTNHNITNAEAGTYVTELAMAPPLYVIGDYLDIWYVVMVDGEDVATIENSFRVYPNLWFTSPTPILYDFSFSFSPNKIRQGSKRYIVIDVTPNVPKVKDIERYYYNLAVVSPLKIYIEQACGDCMPAEKDLRMIVDGAIVDLREQNKGYYFINTEELENGIYNIWFKLEFGDSVYVSEKNQLQIFD